MDTIEKNIQLLIWSIKRSTEYKEYKRCEERIMRHPDMWKRVEHFRADNFRMQTTAEPDEIFNNLDIVNKEGEALRSIPEVNAYLQAELNLCKLLQNISLDIHGSLDIHIPKL